MTEEGGTTDEELTSSDVGDGTGDMAQVDWLVANPKTVLDQEVVTEDPLRHLTENLPSQGHVAVHLTTTADPPVGCFRQRPASN